MNNGGVSDHPFRTSSLLLRQRILGRSGVLEGRLSLCPHHLLALKGGVAERDIERSAPDYRRLKGRNIDIGGNGIALSSRDPLQPT